MQYTALSFDLGGEDVLVTGTGTTMRFKFPNSQNHGTRNNVIAGNSTSTMTRNKSDATKNSTAL